MNSKFLSFFILIFCYQYIFCQNSQLILPKNGDIVCNDDIILKWDFKFDSILNYDIEISKENSFNTIIYSNYNYSSNIIELHNVLSAGNKYFWRIKLNFYSTSSEWSNYNYFEVFSPNNIENSTLCLLSENLSSENNKISTWEDISNNNNNAFQINFDNQPFYIDSVLNNYPSALFTGNNTFLKLSENISLSNFTIYLLLKPYPNEISKSSTEQVILSSKDYLQTKNTFSAIFIGNYTGSITDETISIIHDKGYPNTYINHIKSNITSKYHLLKIQLNESNLQIEIDNNNKSIYTHPKGGLDANNFRSLDNIDLIGAWPGGIYGFEGYIADIIIYNRALTEEEDYRLRSYISHKYVGGFANLGPDINVEYGFCDTVLRLDRHFDLVKWSTGSRADSIIVNKPGEYWVEVTDLFGFTTRDTIVVSYPEINLGDTSVCVENKLTLITDLTNDYNFLWSNGKTDSSINISDAGIYNVTVTDSFGCNKKSENYKLNYIAHFEKFPSCIHLPFSFINNSYLPEGDSIISNYWDFGDDSIAYDLNPTHIFDTTGLFYTQLTINTKNGCVFNYTDTIAIYTSSKESKSFDLDYPLNNTYYYESSMDVYWKESQNAILYDIQVSSDTLFSDLIISIRNLSETHYKLEDLPIGGEIFIRIVAYNSCGIARYSSTRKIISTTPDAFEDMILWLKADQGVSIVDDSLVNQWNDNSSYINNALVDNNGSMPIFVDSVFNNKPAIYFDGNSDFMDLIQEINLDSYSIFLMFKPKNKITSNSNGQVLIGNSQDIYPKSFIWLGAQNSIADKEIITTGYAYDSWPAYYLASTIGEFDTTANLVSTFLNQDTSEFEINNIKTEAFTVNSGPNVTNNRSLQRLQRIGSWDDFDNRYFEGYIAEIIIFNRYLSEYEKETINQYLKTKFVAPSLFLGPDIFVEYGYCDTVLTTSHKYASYLWSDGSTNDSLIVNSNGKYWLEVTDVFGYTSRDTIEVHYPEAAYHNKTLCSAESAILNPGLGNGYTYLWQDNSTDSIINVTQTGDYIVTFTDTLGCGSYTDTINFAISNYEQTATLGPNRNVCKGNNLHLKVGEETTQTFLWNTGSVSSSTVINQSGLYWVIASDENGCTITDSINLSVIGNAPDANFSYDDFCINQNIKLYDNSTITAPNNIINWKWNFSDGQVSTLRNPSHLFNNTGLYTIKLTTTNDVGCKDSISKSIKVFPKPIPDFNPLKVCSNTSLNFNNLSIKSDQSDNIISYIWNFDDIQSSSNISNEFEPSHLFSTHGNYSVKLYIETDNKCYDSIIKIVNVKNIPTADFEYNSNCSGGLISFTNTSKTEPYSGITSWLWEFGDESTSSLENPTHDFPSIDNYNITLIVNTVDGCKDTIIKNINIKEKEVNAYFTANDFCVGVDDYLFDSSTSINTSIESYTWYINNEIIRSGKSPLVHFETSGNKPIELIVRTTEGCVSSYNSNVNVYPNPELDFSYFPLYGAPPIEISILDNSQEVDQYKWNFGVNDSIHLINEPSFTYSDTGTYYIKLIGINNIGCIDSLSKIIRIFNPIIDAGVKSADAQIINNELKLGARIYNYGTVSLDSLTLYADIDNGTSIVERWVGELFSGNYIDYNFNASYEVYEENLPKYLCISINTPESKPEINLENNRQCTTVNNDLRLIEPFPNPVTNELNIEFVLPFDGDLIIEINDIKGIKSAEFKVYGSKGLNSYSFNTSLLQKGTYSYKILFNNETTDVKRFVKI